MLDEVDHDYEGKLRVCYVVQARNERLEMLVN